jgi:VanZ family protein
MKGNRGAAVALALLLGGLLVANLASAQLNRLFLAFPGIDKVLHVGFHALLFPCLHAVAARVARRAGTQTALAFGAGILVAVSDEFIQQFWPGRTVEIGDLVADVAGLGLGLVMAVRPAAKLALPIGVAALVAAGSVTWATHVRLRDYARGLRAERTRDFAQAYEHYLTAYRNGLRTADLFNGLAWTLVESEAGRAGDAARAVDWGRRAHQLEPDNPDILDTYGWALVRAGRAAEGLPLLEEAYARRPRIYCIHYHLGLAYHALGRDADAASHLERQAALTGTHEARLAARVLAALRRR